jgi:hypothetical protein
MKIDQELIKQDFSIQENAFHIAPHYMEKMNDNQGQEEKQLRQSLILEPKSPPSSSSLMKIRPNNLTEIDEDDFFYQGPSPYTTTIANNLISKKIEEPSIPSYKIDEYIDEYDNNERDHVKELEETIANISRHFPASVQQMNDIEINSIETNLHQPSSLSIDKIDIDSILEMEIESPSTDEHYIQSSKSIHSPPVKSSQRPLNIPISVPISVNNHRSSLSRSSGVRENLTDLLTTITTTTESYPTDDRPLQRTSSIHSKVCFHF